MTIRVTIWRDGYVVTWDFGQYRRIHHWFGPEDDHPPLARRNMVGGFVG